MAMDYREKEHAFITIEKDLKGGKVPRVVLLCGSEEYLIEWYAQTLIRRYVSDACRALDLVRLEGDSLTLERIREGLETVSLMSERKVVFLPDFFRRQERLCGDSRNQTARRWRSIFLR